MTVISPLGPDILQNALERQCERLNDLSRDLDRDGIMQSDPAETGNLMLQQERNQLIELVTELQNQITSYTIKHPQTSDTAELGSQVTVQRGEQTQTLWLLSPLEITHKPRAISAVSTASPLGQALLGCQAGSTIQLPGPKSTTIHVIKVENATTTADT